MIGKPKHFVVQEFVPPEIHAKYGESSWRFIHKDLLCLADAVREFFSAPISINTWHKSGEFRDSGYRLPDCKTGAPLSSHKRGMAIDIKVAGVQAPAVQEKIIQNYAHFRAFGLTGIEDKTPTWTHLTVENFFNDELEIIPFY